MSGSTSCWITVARDVVLTAARGADETRATGPLLRVPLGAKDSYLTRGSTAFGNSALRGYVPDHDAEVVVAAKDAGAVVFGKTNLAEMSFG